MDNQIINHTQLIESTDTYSLIIPSNVEEKIRYICNKIPKVEWSGILFYTNKGKFEDGSLRLVCKDIFLMDIGTGNYTEFEENPEVISYMTKYPKFLNCQLGLIHSHGDMKAFFSAVDLDTLKAEGSYKNHFLSLIVNNAGNYVAAITRHCKEKKHIINNGSYKTFKNIPVHYSTKYDVEEEIIVYNMLDIYKEFNPGDKFSEIDKRIEELKQTKKTVDEFPQIAVDYNFIQSNPVIYI